MRTKNQYSLNAFRQAQAFLDDHRDKVGVINDSEGRQLLDASVAELESHGIDQSSSALEIDGRLSLQKTLERELRLEHMLPIASFARARLRGVPDYAALTRASNRLRGAALVRAGRAMAAAAAPYADAFTRSGFPADTVAQLSQAADKLEETLDGRATLRVRRVGATKGISEETKRAHEAVRMLSAVIDRQFAKDRTFLAAWRSAKKVVAKPGVARGSGMSYVPMTATAGEEK